MADLYTPSDDILQRLAANRSAETSAARAALAGPVPTPSLPPVATTPAATVATPVQAQPVNKLAYGAGRAVGMIGNLASKAAVAAPLAGFGDYQANTDGVDTSAGGTLGYLAKGELSNVGASLGGGAAEALADSGRGVAKTIDGLAGYVGGKPGLTQGYDNFISKNMGGYLSLRPQDAAPGPIAAAAARTTPVTPLDQRVAGVIAQMNGGAQPSATPTPKIDPAYDRQPSLVVPSTADKDRQFLAGAFARHVASGDLERARATYDPMSEAQGAQLGAAENAQVEARNQSYRMAPLLSKLQEQLDRSPRERALDEDPRTRAFSKLSKGGSPDNSQGLIASMAALQGQKGTDPGKAAADALTAFNSNQASQTNIEGQKIAQKGQQVTQKGLLQMQSLQTQILNEKDPTKLAELQEKYQTLTGKYEKSAPTAKAVIEDFDTGQKDMMGQPIYKKRAINPETGEPITKPAAAAKPTRAQLEAEAKAAISGGAPKDSVAARLQQKIKEYGL